LLKIFEQGGLIALAVGYAYFLGHQVDGATASTMAFATLTLARLFHGFNCRSTHSIFKLGFASNWYSVGAFLAGVLLLGAVLLIPGLKGLFSVAALTGGQFGAIVLLAFLPTVLIQVYKVVREVLSK
jgi:Ca2+-transporting ATPase